MQQGVRELMRAGEGTVERSMADPDVLVTHPLLDPLLPSRDRSFARFWITTVRRLLRSTGTGAWLHEQYLAEADGYVAHLLAHFPSGSVRDLRLLPSTVGTRAARELLKLVVDSPDSRARYEAQRKICLAKLLFDVDHSRSVRDADRHRALLELTLTRKLWSTGGSCHHDDDAGGGLFPQAPLSPASAQEQQLRPMACLRARDGLPAVEVLHFATRSKGRPRSSEGACGACQLPGGLPCPGCRRSSIVSKLVRRGLYRPDQLDDMVGALFVVRDRAQAYSLEQRLMDALGGPFRWRDRVDTLGAPTDRDRLTLRSSDGFRVLKGVMDLLVDDSYVTPVEIQIYPVADFLHTVDPTHGACHSAFKCRQLLFDLMPLLFPEMVYGPLGLLGVDAVLAQPLEPPCRRWPSL